MAVPQNCEIAARSPPLAGGLTDARNGLSCVGCIDEWHVDLAGTLILGKLGTYPISLL